MLKALLKLASVLVALVAAVLLTQVAQAVENIPVLGREKVATFSVPAGTSGYTLLHEGDGVANFADAYGPFAKDTGATSLQAHYSAAEETQLPIAVGVAVDHRSSRDSSVVTLVLDQEDESGSDLPRAGFGLQWLAGTHPSWPHSALVGNIRLEKPVEPNSNLAFTGEFEYAGEKLDGESARWPKTGSSQDELRLWAGLANRPRLGIRSGLEVGVAANPYGSNVASMPLGLRVGLSRPIEPGNWLEWTSQTQTLVGLANFSLSEKLGLDAAWFRWGTRMGAVALTAGVGLDARYGESAINADLEPRIGVQIATRLGTLRLRTGLALSDRPGWRTELSLLQY